MIKRMQRTFMYIPLLTSLAAMSGNAIAGDTAAGNALYRTHCLSCHGPTGQGQLPGVPNFARGDGLLRGDAELVERILRGRRAMPAYAGILTEAETYDVVAFLRTLQ